MLHAKRNNCLINRTCKKHKFKSLHGAGSFWEAESRSSAKKLACLLRQPKVCYLVHSSQPLVPFTSQFNAVQKFIPSFLDLF
jgi:hypothetical protein